MIPAWSANGDLPPGTHFATWSRIEERLAFNSRRQRLLEGFRAACELLRSAGCRLVYLDGSFVTTKEHPGDFDACWDIQNVDEEALDRVFLGFLAVPRCTKTSIPRRVLSCATAGGCDRESVRRVLSGEQVHRRTERYRRHSAACA